MLKYIINHNSFVYVSNSTYSLEIEQLSRVMSVKHCRNRNSVDTTSSRDSYLKKRLSFTINKEY